MALNLKRLRADYAGVCCPRCGVALRHETLTSGTQVCPRCGKSFEAVHFIPVEPRAFVAQVAGVAADAPCAKHARNKAETACQRCGQFMCSLCRIDADGKSYCPACFERLSGEGGLKSTATKLKNYAGLTAVCACFGVFIPVGLLGIFFAFRGIGQKKRLGEGGVGGFVFGIVFCALEILLGTWLCLHLFGVLR